MTLTREAATQVCPNCGEQVTWDCAVHPAAWRHDHDSRWCESVDGAAPVYPTGATERQRTSGVATPGTLRRMPNAPKTPLKSFRIPEALYAAAQAKAAERGESVSEVVRRALERYVKR